LILKDGKYCAGNVIASDTCFPHQLFRIALAIFSFSHSYPILIFRADFLFLSSMAIG
jgi:hypothetical protein